MNGQESRKGRILIKKDGKWTEVDRVKSVGLEGPFKDGYAGFKADLVIIDDIVSDDNGELAQERRESWRDYLLDTVSAAALRNIRR